MSSSTSLILIFFYLRAKIISENNKGHYQLHFMSFWRLRGQALFPFTPSPLSPLGILRLPLIMQKRVKGQRQLNSSWIDSLSQLNTLLLPLGQSLRHRSHCSRDSPFMTHVLRDSGLPQKNAGGCNRRWEETNIILFPTAKMQIRGKDRNAWDTTDNTLSEWRKH